MSFDLKELYERGDLTKYFIFGVERERMIWQRKHKLDKYDWINISYIAIKSEMDYCFTNSDFDDIQGVNRWKYKRISMYIDRGWVTKIEGTPRNEKQKYRATPSLLRMVNDLHKKALVKPYSSNRE